jgi:hypothetical protein
LATDPAPHLAVRDDPSPAPEAAARTEPFQRELLERLSRVGRPLSTLALRQLVRRRNADVVAALAELRAAGLVERNAHGWSRPETWPLPSSLRGVSTRHARRAQPIAAPTATDARRCRRG